MHLLIYTDKHLIIILLLDIISMFIIVTPFVILPKNFTFLTIMIEKVTTYNKKHILEFFLELNE